MNFNLLAEGLDGSLAEIVAKLQSLIDSFWLYIVIALAAVVVVWGAYIGIKIAIAHRNEEKINARDMIKNLVIGIVIIFVVAHRHRHYIRRCNGRTFAHQRLVRLGRRVKWSSFGFMLCQAYAAISVTYVCVCSLIALRAFLA